jgi:hypothetical protein
VVLAPAHLRCLCELLFDAGVNAVDHLGRDRNLIVLWNNSRRRDVRYYTARGHGQRRRQSIVPAFLSIPMQGGNPWRDQLAMPTREPWRLGVAFGKAHTCVVTGRGPHVELDDGRGER